MLAAQKILWGAPGVKIQGVKIWNYFKSRYMGLPNPSKRFSINYLDFIEHFRLNKGHCNPCMMHIFICDDLGR